jgi:hypothetical protein
MTLEHLSLVVQIVSVLLVPASLVFVGMQMRQTHAIERGNAQRDILDQTRAWWMLCVSDEAMFDAFSKGMVNCRSLNRYQQARFSTLGFNIFHIVEGVFWQSRERLFTDSMREGYYIAFLSIINTPGGRQWWDEAARVGNGEFCAYLSDRLAKEAATLPLWTDLNPFLRVAGAAGSSTVTK